jgi:hypothetical protein
LPFAGFAPKRFHQNGLKLTGLKLTGLKLTGLKLTGLKLTGLKLTHGQIVIAQKLTELSQVPKLGLVSITAIRSINNRTPATA